MIDSNFKVWLIEINTNPWIEESSKLLKGYIPRLINDALKLTIDLILKKKQPDVDENHAQTITQNFPVEGYLDDELFWEHIYTLKY